MGGVRVGRGWVDTPGSSKIKSGLVTFAGWAALPHPASELAIVINGVRHHLARNNPRPDVSEHNPGFECTGWQAIVDVASLADKRGVLLFDIVIDGSCIHRNYYRLSDVEGEQRPQIYFIHMPKTGGTTVRKAMERRADALQLLPVYDEDALTTDMYRRLSDKVLEPYDVIYGHFQHGLHVGRHRPRRYMTVLREPHEYVVSQFLFRKTEVRDPLFAGKSIRDVIRDPSTRHLFDNSFVRYLSGCHEVETIGAAEYYRARLRLVSEFEFVGLTEHMTETLLWLSRYFGVSLMIDPQNVTRFTPERETLVFDELRDDLHPLIRWDVELYELARKMFWNRGESLRGTGAVTEATDERSNITQLTTVA